MPKDDNLINEKEGFSKSRKEGRGPRGCINIKEVIAQGWQFDSKNFECQR